ncbi:MAG TPA: hypothetical protein VHB99_05860, partial [Pirellulales bacterium]|nr:hypothetical protein [Pirellulales bacterium]
RHLASSKSEGGRLAGENAEKTGRTPTIFRGGAAESLSPVGLGPNSSQLQFERKKAGNQAAPDRVAKTGYISAVKRAISSGNRPISDKRAPFFQGVRSGG